MANLSRELNFAKSVWPAVLRARQLEQLYVLLKEYQFSVKQGDLQIIQGHWYVTHSGLLALSNRRHCYGVHSEPVSMFCDSTSSRWAFKAIVYKSRTCKGFVGYGDADPSNVSYLVHGAEMRVAETRAVNRALRKAYGIGTCSVEEMGSLERLSEVVMDSKKLPQASTNGNGHGRTLRDRL